MALNPQIINDLKSFNWQEIINYGCSLDDLNDPQWRFFKGLCMELAVEKNSTMKYVGKVHCDFVWPLHNITAELKTQLGKENPKEKYDGFWKFVKKTGEIKLRKKITVKFTNSRGTNTKQTLTANAVADFLIVLRRDGVVVFDRNTVLKNIVHLGDGFDMIIPVDEINQTIPGGHIIVGPITSSNKYKNSNTLKQVIIDATKNNIPKFQGL